jgi:hypothetical protein
MDADIADARWPLPSIRVYPRFEILDSQARRCGAIQNGTVLTKWLNFARDAVSSVADALSSYQPTYAAPRIDFFDGRD